MEKTSQQWVPHQHLTGLQWVLIEIPFHYHSAAVGRFWEDGTSLVEVQEDWGFSASSFEHEGDTSKHTIVEHLGKNVGNLACSML